MNAWKGWFFAEGILNEGVFILQNVLFNTESKHTLHFGGSADHVKTFCN